MKNILITGGAGFIGSHTCIELVKKGFKLTILDSLVNSKVETINRIKKLVEGETPNIDEIIEFKKGDIRDLSFLEKVFGSKKRKTKNLKELFIFVD